MSTQNTLDRRTLLAVYVWLIALTLVEIGIVMVGIPKMAGVLLMMGTTFGKVLMIALYFMHMKHDRLVTWVLPGIPVLLALFFVLMLFPDAVFHLPLMYR